MIVLFQFLVILMTSKALSKSQPTIRTPNKPSCTDHILTNKPWNFQHYCVINTGLSDFHKMTVTVMKTSFENLQPRVANCRGYKYFENDRFRTDLLPKLCKVNIKENKNELNNFLDACKRILVIHASRK